MKKVIIMFSVFLFISFNINSLALSETQTYSEGLYKITDLKLLPNVAYKVQNISAGKNYMLVFDDNLTIQQSIRFEPNSLQYVLKPMNYDYKIIILGDGKLQFTT